MTTVVEDYRAKAAALLRNPDDPVALLEMFALLMTNGSEGHSPLWLCLAKRARQNAHDEINTVFNHASALSRAGQFREAIAEYHRALELAPPDWRPRVLDHLGIAYRSAGEPETAIGYYNKALALKPGDPPIRQDLAIATLTAGRLNEGLRLHEVRRELAEAKHKNGAKPETQGHLPAGVKHWQGEDLTGKTITIYHEEGIGDFLMWSRFIPRLRTAGADKVFLTGKIPAVLEFVADHIEIDGIVPLTGPIETDYVVGSLTFPWRTGVEYADVTGEAYFHVEPAKIPRRGALNVGLVWRGNSIYPKDYLRSMAFREYVPLFDLSGVAFYSLQIGDAAKEVDELGFTGFVADLASFAKDWRATASLIRALDVVVTVDTAVAHLAGALGKPVIMLITNACDWRWPRDSEKTCWYDSMIVVRQKQQDDWAPCVARVRELLEQRRGALQLAA